MTTNTNKLGTYPVPSDLSELPPTHNHVIGANHQITLDNVAGVLEIIQTLLIDSVSRFSLNPNARDGLICILSNALYALNFEIHYRKLPDDKQDILGEEDNPRSVQLQHKKQHLVRVVGQMIETLNDESELPPGSVY